MGWKEGWVYVGGRLTCKLKLAYLVINMIIILSAYSYYKLC